MEPRTVGSFRFEEQFTSGERKQTTGYVTIRTADGTYVGQIVAEYARAFMAALRDKRTRPNKKKKS